MPPSSSRVNLRTRYKQYNTCFYSGLLKGRDCVSIVHNLAISFTVILDKESEFILNSTRKYPKYVARTRCPNPLAPLRRTSDSRPITPAKHMIFCFSGFEYILCMKKRPCKAVLTMRWFSLQCDMLFSSELLFHKKE